MSAFSPLPQDSVADESSSEDPSEILAAKQEQQYIQELLLRLAPEQREALLLRYYQGLKYEEIAAVLGVSISSAKMRVRRGLTRLREMAEDRV